MWKQLLANLDFNSLIPQSQSAYHTLHNTEMAMLMVINDILCSLDEGQVLVHTLLDQSATFDIDSLILLSFLMLV